MSEALYRKYRPSTFDDVVGQEHIERTLKNALEQEKVSHAYLFCGPRGTGKTTMARILAKALLCEKAPTTEPDGTCEECEAIAQGVHPDVYELDAASRTGVENVREEIINRVHYAPTRGSYKIYIIDEVHMLSTAAFNALLKTLEEPPSHVVFILCTTDPQKVPDTIHSRCQRFDFHRLGVDEIVARLGAVCVQEDVEFEPEALELIAHQAEGGMRNALTSLEQLAAFGEGRVTLDGAHRILGSLDNEGLTDIVGALGRRDAAACFTWVSRYVETGADIAQFVQELAEHIRNLYLLSLTDAEVEISASSSARASMESELELFGTERLSRMLSVLGDLMKELRATTNSRLAFEIALTRLLRPESDLTMESLSERLEELEMKMLSMPVGSFTQAVPASAPPLQPLQAAPSSAHVQAPASTSQVMPDPAPAPQRVPVPVPAPAPQATPTPGPSPLSQPVPASAAAPVAAVQSASAPISTAAPASAVASAPEAPEARSMPGAQAAPVPAQGAANTGADGGSFAAAPAASFDYSNAAALQRMWHQVTTTLRKTNPARGVLFMGAKIEPDPQNNGVKIVFSPDSSFAFAAAQKKEVKELLGATFVEVAGGSVPFQLVMPQGPGVSAPAAPPVVPSAAPVVSPAPQPSATQESASQAVNVSEPVGMAGRYEDESPFRDDDPSAAYHAPVLDQRSAPAHVSQQQSAPTPTPAQAQMAPQQPAAASVPAQASAQAPAQASPQPVAVPAPPHTNEAAEALSESDQIKQILTDSFGDGVKFDTI